MSHLPLIPTGIIIKEYLDEYNITAKRFSDSTGMNEIYINEILQGKSPVTEEFASNVQRLIPSVKAEYWLNYETKYQRALQRHKDIK